MYPDTYSQHDEQQAILAYFGLPIEPHRGAKSIAGDGRRFLDIGAWSPDVFSNTRPLFERGWSGVLIEPSPGPMIGLLKFYGNEPRVELVQAAVVPYADPAPLMMHITDDGLSTATPEVFELWKEKGGYYGQMTVLTLSWEQINLYFGGFQFANIDAEGISVDLFRAMLQAGAEPDCVCCEHDNRLVELCEMATARGYKLLYSNGTNAVFGK